MDTIKKLFSVLVVFLFGFTANAIARKPGTDAVSFSSVSSTLSQSAVFAAFLSSLDGGNGGDTAISVTNLLAEPPHIPDVTDGNKGDREGPLWVYLFDGDGDRYVFESAAYPDVGLGLDEEGVLREGHTWRVLLSEIIRTTRGSDHDFSGSAWVVAGFDAVAGTYTNFFTGIGAGFGAVMEPPLGGIPVNLEKKLEETVFETPLDGDQQVPSVQTDATGMCMGVLNANQTQFKITCMHDVEEAHGAHIHNAPAGQNGHEVFEIHHSSSPFSATWNLTSEDAAELLAGNLYVNVHSEAHHAGEIRGQIIPPHAHGE